VNRIRQKTYSARPLGGTTPKPQFDGKRSNFQNMGINEFRQLTKSKKTT
jgi:hypothetical protein